MSDDVTGTVRLTVNRATPWWYAARRTSGIWHLWDPEIACGAWADNQANHWRPATREEAAEIETARGGESYDR